MIERAVRIAQATSSTTSVVLLVAVNLIPLAGVLFFHWNVATLLVLYWVENGIIGLLNVPKILLAEGSLPAAPRTNAWMDGASPTATATAKIGTAFFFLVHYGLFWFVHGIFVFTLPMFAALGGSGGFGGFPDAGPTLPPGFPGDLGVGSAIDVREVTSTGPDLSAVALGAIGLAISHIASFVINFLGRHEYRKVTPAQQAFTPYGRLMILHVTIIFGAIVSMLIGSPVGAVVVLVLLKTAVDLRFHLREHRALASQPTPA